MTFHKSRNTIKLSHDARQLKHIAFANKQRFNAANSEFHAHAGNFR